MWNKRIFENRATGGMTTYISFQKMGTLLFTKYALPSSNHRHPPLELWQWLPELHHQSSDEVPVTGGDWWGLEITTDEKKTKVFDGSIIDLYKKGECPCDAQILEKIVWVKKIAEETLHVTRRSKVSLRWKRFWEEPFPAIFSFK